MRVELPRPIFKAAIERLSVLNAGGKVKVDAFAHIRLEASPSGLRLSTFNRVMQAELNITEVRMEGGLVCGLPMEKLRDLSSTLPEADLVTLDFDGTGCTIYCGPVKFRIKVLVEDAFPPTAHSEFDYTPINLGFLFHSIGLVSHCVDPSNHRTFAHGIIITPESIVGTDGMRLAKVRDEWIKPAKTIAMTMETVTRLQKLFKGYQEGGIMLRQGEIVMAGGGITAVTKLAAWPIPGVESAFPKGQAVKVTYGKAELCQALERALIIASELGPQTSLHFGEGGLRLETEEDGQLAEDFLAGDRAPPMSLVINPNFLLDAVESIEGDKVVFELRGPETPLAITSEAGDHVNVIMPWQCSKR
jgi:DNA polymerase-3 subunit beta